MATIVSGPNFAEDFASGGTAPTAATLSWDVLYDVAGKYAADAVNEAGIPTPGAAHPTIPALTARTRQGRRKGKSMLFKVVVKYATTTVAIGGSGAEAPTDRDTQWSERGRPSQVEVDREADGTLLQNTAKDVVKLQIPFSDISLIAVKNYAARQDFTAFFNTINSAIFQGYAVKRLYLPHVDQVYTEEFFDGATEVYWQATFGFQARLPRVTGDIDTWEYKIVNEGMNKLVGALQVPIQDAKTHAQISNPVLLDAAGDLLATAAAVLFLNGGATATTTGKVNMFLETDFTTIGL